MNRKLLLLCALLMVVNTLSSQEYSLNFMPDVWNSNYNNPGFFPRQDFIIALPSIHARVNTIGLNRANTLRYENSEDAYYLNYAELIDNVDRDVTLRSSGVVDALAIGFKIKRFFVSLSTNTCVEGSINLPQDFFRAAWDGTASYLDQTLNIGPAFNMIGYQKLGLGLNYNLFSNLSLGVRVNRLIGLASFQTQNSNFSITQSSEYFQTNLNVDYMVNYYAAGGLEPIDDMVEGISNFEGEIGSFELEGGNSFSNFSNGNGGWSVDIGGEYFLNQKWSFAASVLNLGAIRWKNQTQQIRLTEDYTYQGVIIDGLAEEEDIDFEAVMDTLENLIDFEAVAGNSYTQSLSPRTYLSASYTLNPYLTFGGLLYNEFGRYGTFSSLALSSRLTLGRIFSLGGIYAFQSGAFNNLGLNTALKLGPVQIYAIADNIAPLVNTERIDGTSFRAGINLTFGRKKMDKQLSDNLDPNKPQGLVGMSKPSKSRKKKKPKARKKDKTKSEEEGQEEIATAAPVLSSEEENEEEIAFVEEQPKASKRKRDKRNRKKEQAIKQEEPSEVIAGSIAKSNPGNLFHLEAIFKDEVTAVPVDAVYVDIYRVDENGEEVLVRTGRFADGMLDILLNKSKEEHVLLATAYGYDPLTFSFQPIPGNEPAKEQFLKMPTETAPVVDSEQEPALPEELDSIGKAPETELLPVSPDETIVDEETSLPSQVDTSSEEESISSQQDITEEPIAAPVEETLSSYQDITEEPDSPEIQEEIVTEEMTAEEEVSVAVQTEEEVASSEKETVIYEAEREMFYLTERTSLRSHATSSSDVLTRLPVGGELALLEKTNQWWWLVEYKGQQGWVKAHLLERL